jgi:DNA/RNA endonuclease G (NUC1)
MNVRPTKSDWQRCAILLLCGITAAGCATAQPRVRAVPYAARQQSQFTVAEQQNIDRGPFGMPRKDWNFGDTDYVARTTYVLEHHPVDKIPIWVAEHLEADQWESAADRPPASSWKSDPDIDEGRRAELSDYRNSGYDRGHMAPNGDFGSYPDRLSTFILSNAVPQDGPQNSGVWATLEDKVRTLVASRGEGYVITGGMFYEAAEDPEAGNGGGGNGVINYYVIGSNEVAVPTHTFKIFLVPVSNGASTWEAYAMVIANKKPADGWAWSDFAQSVDWVERRTGLDVFPNLTGADESRVEGQKRNPPF